MKHKYCSFVSIISFIFAISKKFEGLVCIVRYNRLVGLRLLITRADTGPQNKIEPYKFDSLKKKYYITFLN